MLLTLGGGLRASVAGAKVMRQTAMTTTRKRTFMTIFCKYKVYNVKTPNMNCKHFSVRCVFMFLKKSISLVHQTCNHMVKIIWRE